MSAMRRAATRQKEAAAAVAVALLVVLAYSLWGSYLLRHDAQAPGPVVADNH